MSDKPAKVAPPESIDITVPGLGGALSKILEIYKFTTGEPQKLIIDKLGDISRDVKNTFNVAATVLAEGTLATAKTAILDCLSKVQHELLDTKVVAEGRSKGRAKRSQDLFDEQFTILNTAVNNSTTAIASLLKVYEGSQSNIVQPLTQYIGGYCANISQYLSNLSTAFQIYRIFLDANEEHWDSLNSDDELQSVRYTAWQRDLNDTSLHNLTTDIVPNSIPKCYRPIFEDKEFYLFGDVYKGDCAYMHYYKDATRAACTDGDPKKIPTGKRAKFKLKLTDMDQDYPWMLYIDGTSSFVVDQRSYVDCHLYTSCQTKRQANGMFRLEHSYRGLWLKSALHRNQHPHPVMVRGGVNEVFFTHAKPDDKYTVSFWQVKDPLTFA